jgi:hypothetical protein
MLCGRVERRPVKVLCCAVRTEKSLFFSPNLFSVFFIQQSYTFNGKTSTNKIKRSRTDPKFWALATARYSSPKYSPESAQQIIDFFNAFSNRRYTFDSLNT